MPRGGKRVGAGRKPGSLTKRTREVAEKAIAAGKTPLEIMLENMMHFQKVALDAEATLEGLTAAEISELVPEDASPDEQFKFLLAQVKQTAGFRQLAQDAARDAAPYIHPKLAAVEHRGTLNIKDHRHDLTDEDLAAIATGSRARAPSETTRPSKLN